MTNTAFWEANFWGILGTISGIAGVIFAWISFRYNKPKIKIEKATLKIPDWVEESWAGKPLSELKNNVLVFELEIQVSNERGGAGSIDKPRLLITFPEKAENIRISPVTEHQEYERETENMTRYSTVRHGKSFNLGAGEKSDEKLKYRSFDEKDISLYANNIKAASYYIEYTDNRGKKYKKIIKKVIKESEN